MPDDPTQLDRLIDAGADPADAPAELREEVALQADIDRSLRRLFETPEVDLDPALDARIDESLRRLFAPPAEAAPPAPIRMPRRRWMGAVAAAAAVALVGAGVWLATRPPRERGLAELYAQHVSSGMVLFPCETPDQFQAWVEENYQASVRPEVEGEDLTFLGWNYDNAISKYTGVMLGKARGEDVVVLVDKASRDHAMSVDPASGLRLFRREVGGLVFYELTPLEEPVFVETLEAVGDGA